MAATITLRHHTGTAGSQTKTDVTAANVRWVTEDAHYSGGTANPIPKPAAGTNNSFWASYRLSCDVTPVGTANNIKVWLAGSSLPSGITLVGQAANVGTNAGYRQATGTTGVSGTQLTAANHSGLTGAVVDPFTWTSGSPKSLAGSITNPSTGDFGDFFVLQAALDASVAPSGAVAAQGATVAWDET